MLSMNVCAEEFAATAARLRVSQAAGLSAREAAQRLATDGPNKMTESAETPLVVKFLKMFSDPMIALLLVSVVISLLVGHYEDAFSIGLAVMIVVTVAFVQEYRSEKAIEALQTLVPNRCAVRRDGVVTTVDSQTLVVGDVIMVSVGNRVSADARLCSAAQLETDLSTFTGESRPIECSVEAIGAAARVKLQVHERVNMVFTGSTVVAGHGEAIVVAVGDATEFGAVHAMLDATEEAGPSPLQERMNLLGKQLTVFSLIVIVFIMAIGCIVQKRTLLDMFQIGVSLAVAAIPEGLPIVVTVTLALGAHRMAAQRAIVKSLPAVETLGCAGVVCADKTGTFTHNEMTAVAVWSPAAGPNGARSQTDAQTGAQTGSVGEFSGSGYHETGSLYVDGVALGTTRMICFVSSYSFLCSSNVSSFSSFRSAWSVRERARRALAPRAADRRAVQQCDARPPRRRERRARRGIGRRAGRVRRRPAHGDRPQSGGGESAPESRGLVVFRPHRRGDLHLAIKVDGGALRCAGERNGRGRRRRVVRRIARAPL